MSARNVDVSIKETISFLRLPLIVAIVFIHCVLTNVNIGGKLLVDVGKFPVYDGLNWLFSQEILRIAMRLFFFISGFLFFYKTDFSKEAYVGKIGRRLRTLVVPYLFWNSLIVLCYFILQTYFPSMTSGSNKLIVDYSIKDWLNVYWSYDYEMPINYPLWFLRDLMILAVISPIIYALIKYLKILPVAVLGVIWCFDLMPTIIGFSSVGLFFFSFGAWFSINKQNFVEIFGKYRRSSLVLYLLLISVSAIFWFNEYNGQMIIHNIAIIIGLITVVGWTDYGLEKGKLRTNKFLAHSSFFIYVYHATPLAFVVKLWVKSFQPASEATMITGYLLLPVIIIIIGILLYYLMQKYLPILTKISLGSR